MDGVLADFDTHYEDVFGVQVSKAKDDVDWAKVGAHPNFYLNMPPFYDTDELWNYVQRYNPIILTGIPRPESVPEAADNKRAWIRKCLDPDVEVVCCRSREKCRYAKDSVLVDDWDRYRHLWVGRGGIWITHISANQTIKELDAIMKL